MLHKIELYRCQAPLVLTCVHMRLAAAQVGHTSQFSREFHERLNMKLWTEFEERMEKLVDAQLETAVRDIMQRVCNRLVSKFCGPAPRKGNLLRLGSVLRSSTQWRHPEAPLHTWLDAELTKRVDLGFLLKVGWVPNGWLLACCCSCSCTMAWPAHALHAPLPTSPALPAFLHLLP